MSDQKNKSRDVRSIHSSLDQMNLMSRIHKAHQTSYNEEKVHCTWKTLHSPIQIASFFFKIL